MAQFLHLLTNSGIGLPTDLWLPATERVQPQFSNQWAVGYARTFLKKYEFSIEGYYKTMENYSFLEMGKADGGGKLIKPMGNYDCWKVSTT